jgi:hypothetical protein
MLRTAFCKAEKCASPCASTPFCAGEERNDWKALTDSIQADRRKLQMENTRLQTQLKNQGIGYSDVDAPRPELPTTRVSPGDADRRRRAPAVTPQAKAAAKGRHVQQKDVAATLSRRQGPPAPRPFSLSALVSAVWASQRKRQRTSVSRTRVDREGPEKERKGQEKERKGHGAAPRAGVSDRLR